MIGLDAAQRLIETPARDECLDARDDCEIIVGLRVLAGLDAAAELVDLGELLLVAVQQDRDAGGVGHELEHLEHLGPARLIVVAHAVLRGLLQRGKSSGFQAFRALRQACIQAENSCGGSGFA